MADSYDGAFIPEGIDYETKIALLEKQHELDLLMATAAAKVKGTAVQESFARLTRVMLLRRTKEQLKPLGQWTRWCEINGLATKHCDDEIDKLGDLGDEVLTKIGSYYGYHLNKIKYLASGDLRKSEVAIENNKLFVDGNEVEMTPDEIQTIIAARDERLQKLEEKASKENAAAEKKLKDTEKDLRRAERELSKIKRQAAKAGMTEEEVAFITAMDEIKEEFESLVKRIDDAGAAAQDTDPITPRMVNSAKLLVAYMKQRLEHVWVKG